MTMPSALPLFVHIRRRLDKLLRLSLPPSIPPSIAISHRRDGHLARPTAELQRELEEAIIARGALGGAVIAPGEYLGQLLRHRWLLSHGEHA